MEATVPDEPERKNTLTKQVEFWLKLHDIYERIIHALKKLNLWTERGPDPDSPYTQETRNAALLNLVTELVNRQSPGNGSINNAGRGRLIDAAIVVTLGLTAWTLKETNANSQAIVVIQCQLTPACAEAVARVKP